MEPEQESVARQRIVRGFTWRSELLDECFPHMKAFVILLLFVATPALDEPSAHAPVHAALVEGALQQVGKTVGYDGSYQRLAYPGGDVPLETGVCSDVLIRAYRHAGIDLQVLVHEDMKKAFQHYPRSWGLPSPDPNIDHRRVLNLATFFRRRGTMLAVSHDPKQYRPGDIVIWRLPNGLPHIGLIAREKTDANPLVVHNIGAGAQLEDILFAYEITGHFRYLPEMAHPTSPQTAPPARH